ncbi:glycerol-3-phosphate dehydrogenase/oxidase [Candidatus Poribacteria bacterium]|nr:glycerol-3-phosphate dehydrogenase/oxidase [Candidatus Poribacteria bacterium]
MTAEFSNLTRSANINKLQSEPLDVLVIGGGIVGAGLIRDLTLNGGIKTGLIDQGDFACGTSSASSQLIHGGFRYISKLDIGLVRQSRKEREILHQTAPNLVKPIPIAILCYKDDPYPFLGVDFAARVYNRLSKSNPNEKSKVIRDCKRIETLLGPIATDGLKGCVVLWDSQVDDSRLTLAILKDAHQHGGIISNYVRFLGYNKLPDESDSMYQVSVEDVVSGKRFEIKSRRIVSATGPWTDKIWEKDPSYDGHPRLVSKKAKGVHIILPRCAETSTEVPYGIVAITQSEKTNNEKQRAIFILPGQYDTSIIGTTETTPENELESVCSSKKEIDYLLSETQRVYPNLTLNKDSIIGSYAGVRPLIANNGSQSRINSRSEFVSRDHLITDSQSGILYVYGGKLTTHRQIAEETVDYIAESLNVARDCKTALLPLPAAISDNNLMPNNIDMDTLKSSSIANDRDRLIQRYGMEGYIKINKLVSEDSTLSDPISEKLPFIKAEIAYSCWGEMAITLEDILWRRTRIGWTQGQGMDIAGSIAELIGEKQNWDQARITSEVEKYNKRIDLLNSNI